MLTSLTLTLILLLAGSGVNGSDESTQTPTAGTASDQQTPPPENDVRAHIIEIG